MHMSHELLNSTNSWCLVAISCKVHVFIDRSAREPCIKSACKIANGDASIARQVSGYATALLDKMGVNNGNQIHQINSQNSETETMIMRDENKPLKIEIQQLKVQGSYYCIYIIIYIIHILAS